MSAKPARPLLTAYRNSNVPGGVVVTLTDVDGEATAVGVDKLSRSELCRLIHRVGGSPKRNGEWLTNDEMLAMIRDLVTSVDPINVSSEADNEPRTPRTPRASRVDAEPVDALPAIPAHDEPKADAPKPRVIGNDAAAAAQALIDALSASQSAQVDEDAVRRIARDVAESVAVELLDAMPAPRVIQMPGRQDVRIDERTHAMFDDVLTLVGCGIHPMLVGPAGTGKTTLAHQVAKALGRSFGAISLHPQIAASQLFGFIDATGTYRTTPFRQAFEQGGVFLFDELDNGHPGVLAGINQALANGECAFADGMVARHPDFVAVGAANTFGTGPTAQYVGRSQLDAATLDRFYRVEVDVDEDLETGVVRSLIADRLVADRWLKCVRKMRSNVTKGALRVIVSPRCSIDGARLVGAGWTFRKAVDGKVLAGLTDDVRSKVTDGVSFD